MNRASLLWGRFFHKTIAEIVKIKPSYITMEDLNVKGMMKNCHLSKAVAGQKFYEFRTKLQFKRNENGVGQVNLKERTRKLKTDIPALFLALQDKETPIIARIFAGITVAYALSPIDLVPDFIPVLGYLDDVIILPMLVILTVKFIPEDVLERNRKQSEAVWKEGKPKKWYFAIPVVLVWGLLVWTVVKVCKK